MPSPPHPQAIIFDFGGVLCTFDINIFLRRIAPYTSLSFLQLQAALPRALSTGRDYETGRISSTEFYRRICALTGVVMPEQDFARAYCEIFSPVESTFTLVRQLKSRYRLGLLSNTSEWHFEYGIRPVAVFPLFETVTLSYAVKCMKPDRAIYEDALAKLGLPPEVCVYIDDLPENVDAAHGVGMQAIHYTGHEQLVHDLAVLGVQGEPGAA